MRKRFRRPLLPIALAAVALAGGACTDRVHGKHPEIALGPVLPMQDPVADIVFGPDRSLCAHGGPVDPAIVAQLNASAQPLVRRHGLFSRLRIVMINVAQRLQYITAFLRKVIGHLHHLPPAMRQAVRLQGIDSFHLRRVAG